MSCANMAEPIKMPFRLWVQVCSRNDVLDWVEIGPCKGAIFEGKHMPTHGRRHSAVSCAKMAELIEMLFGLWIQMDPRNHVLHGLHIGATWRIQLNRPCAAEIWTYCQITLTTC